MERSKKVVLDSSVIVKWFSQEEHTKEALEIRKRYFKGEAEIVVPDLILYEISNALRYNPNFNERDVERAVDSLYNMEIDIVMPTPEVLKSASNLAFKKDITIYDAFYVALAKEIEFDFITADEKLHKKISDLKFVKLLRNLED